MSRGSSQTDYVGSSAGAAVTFGLSHQLTDAEFRLLMLTSECPDGEGFSTDLDFLTSKGMNMREALRAAEYLSGLRDIIHDQWDTQFFLRRNDTSSNHRVVWRFYK